MNAIPRYPNVHISRTTDGIELYHPPLRTPALALLLALFGLACLVPALLAIAGIAPRGEPDAMALLVLALMGVFVLPLLVFGAVFMVGAVTMLANSLTVEITAAGIRTVRRVLGFVVAERALPSGDIADIELQLAARYQGMTGRAPYYRLVARSKSGPGLPLRDAYRQGKLRAYRNRLLIVAESLQGEATAQEIRALILRHAGHSDLF